MARSSTGTQDTVALIFGGIGSEHGVSCLSARSILRALEAAQYEVMCLGICQSGEWAEVSKETVRQYVIDSGVMPEVKPGGSAVSLALNSRTPGFFIGSQFVPCRVVFPIVHGVGGEDGRLQGLLDSTGISYVGSGVEASAICMNKVSAKRVIGSVGIETGNWLSADGAGPTSDAEIIQEHFKDSAVFVKPVAGGSSSGITRVLPDGDLDAAISAARTISRQVIVEQALVAPRELEVAVLQTSTGLKASPVGEIKVHPEFEFYDFNAKYIDNGADLIVPAKLEPEVANRIQVAALRIFETIGCRDYARVDFFLDQDHRVIFNEINTAPGFTSISMFSRMWEAGGVDFYQLVDQLIGNAISRSTKIPDAG